MIGILILLMSILAGTFGSIFGLGGGIIIIPSLTLIFGIDIRHAIGASIISVIATSSGAAARYIKDHITNIRLAIFLEMATTTGAILGAFLSSYFSARNLFILFSILLFYSSYSMWKNNFRKNGLDNSIKLKDDPLANKLNINSTYYDQQLGQTIHYKIYNVIPGFFFMFGAGILSALLGIGSGILKVLAMDTAMKVPIKVSSATSNFMIGVTAAASAGAYFIKGDIIPEIAAPVAIGVLIGAFIGSHIMHKMKSETLRTLFILLLVVVAIQMIYRGITI